MLQPLDEELVTMANRIVLLYTPAYHAVAVPLCSLDMVLANLICRR